MTESLTAGAPSPLKEASTLLDVRNLSVGFSTRRGMVQAVDDVSFTVGAADSVGILGESGCGKSVMAQSIMGLGGGRSVVASGSILYSGPDKGPVDLRRLDPKGPEYRAIRGAGMAMVFQDPMSSLNPVYSIGDQIVESVHLHRTRDARAARGLMLDALSQVGLPDPRTVARSYPHQLSGGMRQRAMIALALACEPALLIADEPTTALDVTTAAQIIELLADIQSRRRMAIMFITHDMGILANLAREVIVMYLGRIVERGQTRQVFKNPSHPYTRGLLDSVPEIGVERRAIRPIQGSVQEPIDLPPACRFRERCPLAFEKCFSEPPLFHVEDRHVSRCWRSQS